MARLLTAMFVAVPVEYVVGTIDVSAALLLLPVAVNENIFHIIIYLV